MGRITYARHNARSNREDLFRKEMTLRLHVSAEAAALQSTYVGHVTAAMEELGTNSTEPYP